MLFFSVGKIDSEDCAVRRTKAWHAYRMGRDFEGLDLPIKKCFEREMLNMKQPLSGLRNDCQSMWRISTRST